MLVIRSGLGFGFRFKVSVMARVSFRFMARSEI